MEKSVLAPKDKGHAIFFLFFSFGLFAQLPMNFFNTATDYWMYKFRTINETEDTTERNDLQREFISDLNIVSTIGGIVFLVLTLSFGHYIKSKKRILITLTTIFIGFFLTLVFVLVDTDEWQQGFLVITLVIGFFASAATSTLSVSIFMVIANFPKEFIAAMMIGMSFGSIISAALQVFVLAVGPTSTASAFIYFTIIAVLTIFDMIYYLFATRTEYFKFYFTMESPEEKGKERSSVKQIVKKVWVLTLGLLISYFITHSMHPGVTSNVVSTGSGDGSAWSETYFTPVITYLLFNVFELFGKIASVKIQKPSNPKILLVMGISRIVFVPLILLCNTSSHDKIPSVINDAGYIIILILMSFTDGYMTNTIAMLIPAGLSNKQDLLLVLPIVGITMGLGQVVGSFASLAIVKLL